MGRTSIRSRHDIAQIRCIDRWMAVMAVCLLAAGCSEPRKPGSGLSPSADEAELIVETGEPSALALGEAFHFVERFAGAPLPASWERRPDGPYRLALGEAYQPILHTPAPYVMRQKLALPAGAVLRLAFGLAEESGRKRGDAVRFVVRTRCEDERRELLSEVVLQWEGPGTPNWSPVTLDLSFAAGKEVELELATEIADGGQAAAPKTSARAHAVWVNPVVLAPAQHARPNILLVLVDALRADHLGCYGYDRPTTPFLDRLAREGVLFEQAHAQATYTFASVPSILTSTYRFVTGGEIAESSASGSSRGAAGLRSIDLGPSLQGQLRGDGYTTLACVGGGYLSPALGNDSGFDWYWSPRGSRPGVAGQLSALRELLESKPQTPFFLFLHSYEVHSYFQGRAHCLAEFDRGYLGKLARPGEASETVLGRSTADLSQDDLQYIVDLYDGEIRYTDRYLETFVGWLLTQPWGRDTIVILTADHGEMLGEQGRLHHGGVPYRPLVHVPLIMRFPDGRWRGRRVREPVSLVDLTPTLLDFAGIAPPGTCVGQSLRGLVEGGKLDEPGPVFCESRFDTLLVREGRWWYLTRVGERLDALYDMATDPTQTKDLSAERPETVRRMRSLLSDLAMKAARGARIAVTGTRPERLTVDLECEDGFSYLYCPTIQVAWGPQGTDSAPPRGPGRRRPRRLRVPVPSGSETHVILFQPASPDATVLVSATADDREVEPRRFHLGKGQVSAKRVPVAVSANADSLVAASPPVRENASSWGIWIWLAPGSMRRGVGSPSTGKLPPGLERQLRALGYLR